MKQLGCQNKVLCKNFANQVESKFFWCYFCTAKKPSLSVNKFVCSLLFVYLYINSVSNNQADHLIVFL